MLTGWFQFGAAQKVEGARPLLSSRKIPTDSFRPEDNRLSTLLFSVAEPVAQRRGLGGEIMLGW